MELLRGFIEAHKRSSRDLSLIAELLNADLSSRNGPSGDEDTGYINHALIHSGMTIQSVSMLPPERQECVPKKCEFNFCL